MTMTMMPMLPHCLFRLFVSSFFCWPSVMPLLRLVFAFVMHILKMCFTKLSIINLRLFGFSTCIIVRNISSYHSINIIFFIIITILCLLVSLFRQFHVVNFLNWFAVAFYQSPTDIPFYFAAAIFISANENKTYTFFAFHFRRDTNKELIKNRESVEVCARVCMWLY